MANTVDEGFRTFLSWLTPTGGESEAAKNHRASIEDCLKKNFGITRFFRSGSFGNGTSVSGYSDVDYFASIPVTRLKQDSNATLREVRNVLAARFPLTQITVNNPAVRVPFGRDGSESTEIVPAEFLGKDGQGRLIYDIPSKVGGWMKASPDSQNEYVAKADKRFGGKVKALVRFMKAWKFYNSVPISSFYLEMFTTQYADSQPAIVYSIDVEMILVELSEFGLTALDDPLGVSSAIQPCDTQQASMTARAVVERDAKVAIKAREAESDGDISTAFLRWDEVFNGGFPGY